MDDEYVVIRLKNSGGDLDVKVVKSGSDAAAAAVRMIRDAGSLYAGDRLVVDYGSSEREG